MTVIGSAHVHQSGTVRSHRSLVMGPEVWYLVYSGRVQLGPPRTPVGVPEVGVSSQNNLVWQSVSRFLRA